MNAVAPCFEGLLAAICPPAAPLIAPEIVVEQSPAAIATVLSPSQVRTFMDCQARWMFHYLWELPESRNGNLALGIAVHAAVAWAFDTKLRENAYPEVGDVVARFGLVWDQTKELTEFRDDEDPGALGKQGAGLVEKYCREAIQAIEPAGVEVPVEGRIGGVRVQGRLDLTEVGGRVRDIKTSSRKASAVSSAEAFQLATYVPLCERATGEVVIDQLVKTKTPQLVQLEYTIRREDLEATERLYPLAQEMMRSGHYFPNRCSNLCSRRNCAYWRECEREFGGIVEAS